MHCSSEKLQSATARRVLFNRGISDRHTREEKVQYILNESIFKLKPKNESKKKRTAPKLKIWNTCGYFCVAHATVIVYEHQTFHEKSESIENRRLNRFNDVIVQTEH